MNTLTMTKQDGFGLIEVSISILILTVTFVGLSLLQIKAIQHNHRAELRALALVQAQNMVNRMVANPSGVSLGSYNNINSTPASIVCGACTEAQVAQYDAYYWNTLNANLLPSGRGTVTGNGSRFTVSVYWDADRSGATGLGCSDNTSVDLSCVRLEVQL